MRRVAKLVLIDKDGKYLLLFRSGHPSFPNDPDLPGGTLEKDEEPIHALIREVSEEAGIALNAQVLEKLHESDAYDKGYTYYLYGAKLNHHPSISISWEHSRYEWLTLDDFITKTRTATDKYMHMVYDYLSQSSSRPTR